MQIVKPNKLEKGDLIGIISPASTPDDLTKINDGVKYLEGLGYSVEVGKNVGKYNGYLAGTDSERLDDLHYMFKKKEVKAIFCVRGGYGSERLLEKINFNLIKKNPKIFVGYSDITALQLAFYNKAGLVTFAGPMVASNFSDEEVSKFTEEMFWALLTSKKKFGRIKLPNDEKLFCLTKGSKTGRLIGGNLAVFASLIGSKYMPNLKDKILILEDIGEVPYKIDRLLNQLKITNVFNKINGLIFGTFVDCNEKDPNKRTLTLGEVIDDYTENLSLPIIYNFKHGHIKDTITVPFGINFKVNASRCFVDITESTVK